MWSSLHENVFQQQHGKYVQTKPLQEGIVQNNTFTAVKITVIQLKVTTLSLWCLSMYPSRLSVWRETCGASTNCITWLRHEVADKTRWASGMQWHYKLHTTALDGPCDTWCRHHHLPYPGPPSCATLTNALTVHYFWTESRLCSKPPATALCLCQINSIHTLSSHLRKT